MAVGGGRGGTVGCSCLMESPPFAIVLVISKVSVKDLEVIMPIYMYRKVKIYAWRRGEHLLNLFSFSFDVIMLSYRFLWIC